MNTKIILQGPTGSGKSTILLERYKYMVEKLNIPSEKILILLLNKDQLNKWRNSINFINCGAIWRTSYYNFIQTEIKTYYPIILKNNENILTRDIKPIFSSFEIAQFLISKAIEGRRNKAGAFGSVTTLNEMLASELTSNLLKAATSDIPFNEIGNRLFNSLENKSTDKQQLFKDSDDVMKAYENKCMELGIYDFGLAVDIYNNCLLKDELYISQLFNRVEHIIVDNLEECVPTEIDFLSFLLKNVKSCLFAYNHEGGFGEIYGGNHEYMMSKINGKCKTIELSESFNCNENIKEFSDKLFDNIINSNSNRFRNDYKVERVPAVELRSEMLEKVAEKIIDLINIDGYKPGEIVVLSTYADIVTELVIGRILQKQGYQIKNLAKRDRIIDNIISRVLVTLAQLCHPSFRLNPNKNDLQILLSFVLKLDPVRSSILASEILNQNPFPEFPDTQFLELFKQIGSFDMEKYEHIRNWINNYKKREIPLPIDEFLQIIFLEILITVELSEEYISQTNNIISRAQAFIEVVKRFNKINVNKSFIEMLRGDIKATESFFEEEEINSKEYIFFSTPVKYLLSSLNSKVIILTSISSSNWSPRSIKEMSNNHVLNKTWDVNKIYTEEQEEENQKHYLANLMRAILKRCKDKVITFESNLSANGYENDGVLSEYFNEILS